jgi:prepilin-type N-terminal cleavage/methylation domain-containing protein
MRRVRSDQRGFTLVEVLVTLALVAALATITISVVDSLFNSNLRANQLLEQQQTIETTYGFFAQRLALAQRNLGDVTGSGANQKIDPLTIGPDQLMFTVNGVCYRVFYLEHEKEIRAATDPNGCQDPDIKPKRLPNEKVPAGHAGAGTTHVTDVNDPLFDPALDGPFVEDDPDTDNVDESALYADASYEISPANTIPPAPDGRPRLKIFQYFDDRDREINFDPEDTECSDPPSTDDSPYCDITNRTKIATVKVNVYVDAVLNSSAARVRARQYSQRFSLNQVCVVQDPNGGNGVTPGTVYDAERVDGLDDDGYRQLSSGDSETYQILQSADPDNAQDAQPLRSRGYATEPTWLRFNGAVAVRAQSGNATAEITVSLHDADTHQLIATDYLADGRREFVYSTPASSGAWQTIPLSGAFQLTDTGPDPSKRVYVKVTVKAVGGSIDYSTSTKHVWLQTEQVARG